MKESNSKPMPQTYAFELPALGELKLELEETEPQVKPLYPAKKDVNEDLIHRLIDCLKKI
ncbi:MAG: hypothetical protein H6636_07390 [Anaerolineales bacterium]|nr:hypothetical protein [Anaerolineales bacterium]